MSALPEVRLVLTRQNNMFCSFSVTLQTVFSVLLTSKEREKERLVTLYSCCENRNSIHQL